MSDTNSLFARVAGETGPAVALLHGFGASHRVWEPVQAALADGARLIAYDLPGHGHSLDYPEAGPARTAVRAVLADLSARLNEPVHLVGHSMGGAVATLAAIAEPARVASLTLLAPGGFGPEINGRLLARYAAARDPEALRAALEAMTGWYAPVTEKAVADHVEARPTAAHTAALVRIAAVLSADSRQGVIPAERLAAIACPVSVAWGRLDAMLPFHQTASLPERFGLHALPRAGHMLPDEAPDLAIELIRRRIGQSG